MITPSTGNLLKNSETIIDLKTLLNSLQKSKMTLINFNDVHL